MVERMTVTLKGTLQLSVSQLTHKQTETYLITWERYITRNSIGNDSYAVRRGSSATLKKKSFFFGTVLLQLFKNTFLFILVSHKLGFSLNENRCVLAVFVRWS